MTKERVGEVPGVDPECVVCSIDHAEEAVCPTCYNSVVEMLKKNNETLKKITHDKGVGHLSLGVQTLLVISYDDTTKLLGELK